MTDSPGIVLKQRETKGALPFHSWIAEIFAGGQEPGIFEHFGQGFLEVLWKSGHRPTAQLTLQAKTELLSFQSCHSHALPIDRIKATSSITQDHQTIWQVCTLIMTSPISRD